MTTETNKTYRALPREEIDALKQRRCRADDWTNVQVAEGFAPDALEDVTFSAPVKLGQVVEVRNVKLHRCIVGDGVVIGNVPGGISNYDIAEGARIQNVDVLATTGESSFGNGVTVEALNEGGGRELKIFDRLSAQLAYLMICYRHRPKLIERLESIIDAYIANVRSDRGEVGRDAHIVNCGTLLNLRIGPAACLDGAARLENGSINSCPEAPARVGTGVIAKDFIIGSGSRVDGQALLTDCLTMCKNIGLSMDILDFDFASRLLIAGTGLKFSPEKVTEALNGVIERDRRMNIDFGVTADQDTLPRRFTQEPLEAGASKGQVVPVERMVKEYYQLKGWDGKGVPRD